MSTPFFIELIIIFVLVLANGFFSASEIAIVSARHSRLQQKIDEGKESAQQALDLAEHPDRFLATVQVGITLISTFTAAFSGASISAPLAIVFTRIPFLAPYADTLALGTVVVLLTYVSLILGELVPKRLALQFAERIAMSAAPTMVRLAAIARPIIALLNASVNVVLYLLRFPAASKTSITEEDIVYLAREGIASGTVEKGEEQFIDRIFRFTDRPVSSILTPRTEIVAVEVGTSFSTLIDTFLDSGYSRLPLYQDSPDNIVGILYAKDLLRVRNAHDDVDLTTLARPPFFVSEYQHADDLLATFRREGVHLAIVLDEYSQVTGLITMEDMLEELVGEIQDEYDKPEDNAFIRRGDGSWLVDGMVAYDTVWSAIGMQPPPGEDEDQEHDYHTLAGLILSHLGRIPGPGDTVTIGNVVLEVVDMDGRRIDKVLIRPKQNN